MSIDSDLKDLASDNVSGSTELAIKVSRFFVDHAVSGPQVLEALGKSLYSHFSGMGLVRNTILELLEVLSKDGDIDKSAKEIRLRISKQSAKALENAGMLFQDKARVVTISRSSQVEDAIIKHSKNVQMVYVLESRPKLEGVAFYKSLTDNGIEATLVTDASMGIACRKSDFAFVGCDSLLGDGTLIHKIGTLPLFTVMRYFSKSNYAIGIGMKEEAEWAMGKYPQFADHGCEELGIEGGNCINRYFESVPGPLLSGFVNEKGLIQVSQKYA